MHITIPFSAIIGDKCMNHILIQSLSYHMHVPKFEILCLIKKKSMRSLQDIICNSFTCSCFNNGSKAKANLLYSNFVVFFLPFGWIRKFSGKVLSYSNLDGWVSFSFFVEKAGSFDFIVPSG